jgi:hypothetical protein
MRTLISLNAAAVLFLAASSMQAGVISTAGANVGTPVDVLGITGFTTLGSGMAGMTVTATFVGGATDSCVWAATSATAGGCSTALFTVSQDGDTFSQPWSFATASQTPNAINLLFDGVGSGTGTRTGGTVFDRTFGGATGTAGTSDGFDADGTTVGGDGVAAYQDVLTILGAATSGDVYARVNIRFADAGISSATWRMDTDSVGLGDGAVPEPSTWAMLGGALVGMGLWRRRI